MSRGWVGAQSPLPGHLAIATHPGQRNPALPAGAVHDLVGALAHPRTVLTDSFGSAAIDDSE